MNRDAGDLKDMGEIQADLTKGKSGVDSGTMRDLQKVGEK